MNRIIAKIVSRHEVSFLVILLIISLALAQKSYTALLLANMGIYTIAVSGLDILFGYSGQISFGQAGFYAIGAYTSAILTTKLGVEPFLGIFCGCLLSALVAAVIALPAIKLQRHFLSFMTIAFGQVVYSFVGATSSLTNGFSGINNIPPVRIFGYALRSRTDFFYLVLVFTVIAIITKRNIIASRTGRAMRAIKGNIAAANSMGVNIYKYKMLAFVISGLFTGLAGALYAHMVLFISPDTFQATQSTLFMTMLLFGGLGSLLGPVIGAILITLVQLVLQPFAIYQMLVYGLLIIFILFFMPNGVNGIFDVIKNKLRKKSDYAEAESYNR